MSFAPKQFTFNVDLPGLIDLMGTALYSEPQVAIRELIQNAHDGIMRRRMKELDYQGAIRFYQDKETRILRIEDDGIGLNSTEAEKYLGTLGTGLTGLIRRETSRESATAQTNGLIGQFGIGLLSAFLLSEKIVVESLKADGKSEPIRWEADGSTIIHLSPGSKKEPGTTVILQLRPAQQEYTQSEEKLETAIREYADFLNIPIYLGEHSQRINLMEPAWFEPEVDEDRLLSALESRFNELPLCVIPIQREKPVAIRGALYVSPERLPGFTSESRVIVTVRRMIISHKIQGLVPEWAPFIRGVLELTDCHPTASREELVRDDCFYLVKRQIEEELFAFFERLVETRPAIWESLLTWHRYMLSGAAIGNERLRHLLLSTYRFSTHRGRLTFDEIIQKVLPSLNEDGDLCKLIWYHCDRRQEAAMDSLFAGKRTPCVHATSTFEETLLYTMANDVLTTRGERVECRVAVPGTRGFSTEILHAKDQRPIDDIWDLFFESLGCKIYTAECDSKQPVFAFLNERQDLLHTINSLKQEGTIPLSFQRMIDRHLNGEEMPQNQLLLNRSHPLIKRVLQERPTSPLAAVVRVLVFQTMQSAGAQLDRESREQLDGDLLAIADAI